MPNPYIQVMLTYLRHPFSSVKRSLLISGISFFFALSFFISGFNRLVKHDFFPIYYILFIILFAYWADHVKEQFADARASLLPDFRKVHGVAATIVAIVFVILLPGAIALLIDWQSLGLVSITTFLFGIILWFILRPGFTFFFFMLGGLNSMFIEPINKGIERIVWGMEPIQAIIIIGIGIILSITGLTRLFLLNEEKPEYHLNFKFPLDGRTKLSDLQWQKLKKSYSRGLRGWFTNKMVVKMIYHARHTTDSYWSGIQRWNCSGLSVWFALYVAAIIYPLITVVRFFNITIPIPRLALWINMATIMPVFLVNKQFKVKSRFMAHDLMMPVARDAYLKQVGMSLASSQFIQWGVFLTVSALWIFTDPAKPTPEFLIISISYSLMIQILMFGLGIWISSFNSTIMNFLSMIAVIALAMPLTVMPFNAETMIRWHHLIMPSACLLAAIGLLLTWWSYRRWLVADIN